MGTCFQCRNSQSCSKTHSKRLERICAFLNIASVAAQNSINDLLTPLETSPFDIYAQSYGRNCIEGNCFVMQGLPDLLRAVDRARKIELRKHVGKIPTKELEKKKESLLIKKIQALREIGEIYDHANLYSSIDRPDNTLVSNRFELFNAVARNPDAVNALASHKTQVNAKELLSYAPFLSKLYLNLLAHEPECVDILVRLKAGPRDFSAQKKGLEDLVKAERVLVLGSRKYLTWTDAKQQSKKMMMEEADDVLRCQLAKIKNYFKLHFIRLGALYIKEIGESSKKKWKGGKSTTDEMRLIFEEMSHFSNAILSVVTMIVRHYYSRVYGDPRCDFAVLLGGANARREFPSFDYDAIAVYEKQGITRRNGIEAPIAHRVYFEEVFARIKAEMNDIGLYFEFNYQEFIVWYNFQTKYEKHLLVPSLPVFRKQLKRRYGKMLYVALSNLIVGAGDESFGRRVRKTIDHHIWEGSGQLNSIALPLAGRIERDCDAKANPSILNVKKSPGGLRDINEANWVNGLCKPNYPNFNDVLIGLKQLPLTRAQKKDLQDSYLYLINLRIRLDLYYGRNEKKLPTGDALNRLAYAVGYRGQHPGKRLVDELKVHMRKVRKLSTLSIDHWLNLSIYKEVRKRARQIVALEKNSARYWKMSRQIQAAENNKQYKKKKLETEKLLAKKGMDPNTIKLWARTAMSENGMDDDDEP